MSKKSKRFQSGREVLETYVPGYPGDLPGSSARLGDAEDAVEMAEALIVGFGQRVGGIRKAKKARKGLRPSS